MTKCTRCGKREATEVHHLDGNHDNNDPENLMKICARCHAELHDIQPNLAEAKVQYENLKDLENTRIRIENRIRGLKRKWGISTELLEEELKTIRALERKVERKLIEAVKNREIFKWLESISGIAAKTAAELIALIGDIGRFDTISSLWHYAGLHVDEGKAPKPRKGKKIDYHPKLKSLCLGIIGQNFLRSKSPYRRFYDEKKSYYETNREWKKGHRHNAAIRFMVKQFVKDLWLNWRRLESLPVTEAHPQDQPTQRMETMQSLCRPAGAGDAGGLDQNGLETHRDAAPPAGLKITTPHPQDKPKEDMESSRFLRRPAGAGDMGRRTSPDFSCTPCCVCAIRRPLPITEAHPQDQSTSSVKTSRIIHRLAEAGDTAGGPDQIVNETHQTFAPPAGSNHSFMLQNGR